VDLCSLPEAYGNSQKASCLSASGDGEFVRHSASIIIFIRKLEVIVNTEEKISKFTKYVDEFNHNYF
jgi:hypothetical protein